MIEKRIILSYARTGSTPVLDVYRKFQESYYPNSIRVVAEAAERNTWRVSEDFDMIRSPYDDFKKKYDLTETMRYLQFLPEERYREERQKVATIIFDKILQEDVYCTKMFPEQFESNFFGAKRLLERAVDSNAKIIGLYRKNFTETLASVLMALEDDLWVRNKNWKIKRLRAKESDYLDNTERGKLHKKSLKRYLDGIIEWWSFVKYLEKAEIPVTLVAYEDIPEFNYKMLNYLEGTKFLSGYETCLEIQRDTRDKANLLVKNAELITECIEHAKKHLPLNALHLLDIKK